MYRVIKQFHDAKTFRPYPVGEIIVWDDADRIKSAIERGLIEEVEEKKPKATAKKKASTTKRK